MKSQNKKSKKHIAILITKIACLVIGILPLLGVVTFSFRKNILHEQYPTTFGMGHSVVVSKSMEPTIHVGDLVITIKKDSYQEGDVITFKQDDYLVTHRVYVVTENGYITWGDNRETNTVHDREIMKEDVLGKVVRIVPKLGYAIDFCSNGNGKYFLIGLAALCVVAMFIPEKETKENKNEEVVEKN